jgi:hypothetical protein
MARLKVLIPIWLPAVILALVLFVPPAADAQSSKSKATDAPAKSEPSAQVDLNTATQKELETLPGVGPATAKKIMEKRPYTSVQDLSRAGLSTKTIDKISSKVVIGAAASTAPAATTTPAPSKPTPAARSAEPAKSTETAAQTPPAKGMVWVNTESKVFHHESDRWYGKTKHGQFMTEAEALKAGYRAAKERATKQ